MYNTKSGVLRTKTFKIMCLFATLAKVLNHEAVKLVYSG